MAVANSSIEWTESTWSPVTGCTKVSPGCDHCYAEGIANRFAGTKAFPNGFAVTLRPERMTQPLSWRKPRRIFVNSMSDLFHDEVPDSFIAEVFGIMALAERHTFQLLTKRHGRMRSLLRSDAFADAVAHAAATKASAWGINVEWAARTRLPLPNVHLGVSVEDQKWANIRVPMLLDTPAAVRWLSCEPLLGPVDLRDCGGVDALQQDWVGGPWGGSGAPHPFVDWVVVGGESGPGARPLMESWVESIVGQCQDAKVPVFVKQLGAVWGRLNRSDAKGGDWDAWPAHLRVREYPTADLAVAS